MQELKTYQDLKEKIHLAFLTILKQECKITKADFLQHTNLCKSNGGAYYDGKKIPSPQKVEVLCHQLNISFAKVLSSLNPKLNS